jgi:NDP-sugar pyrophosphorylase family protein
MDMVSMAPVCILAGGLGTRLGALAVETPKPIIEVAGEPFLFHPLRSLAAHAVEDVVICVGYRGDQIESRLGKERFGIRIRYSYDEPGLSGTLGAIRRARHLLGERFLVLYGDTYLRVDYGAVVREWWASNRLGIMTVLHNRDQWGPSNTSVRAREVVLHSKTETSGAMEWIDYGLGGLKSSTLDLVDPEVTDLSVLYGELARRRELYGFEVRDRFYEIGTPERLAETDLFLRSLGNANAL